MPKALECLHMNHINAMVEDLDRGVAHLRDLYGAQFNRDLPGEHWHACLITIGGVMFELFAPSEYLLHARFGPHYVGVEYQVPDVDDVRAQVLARGMRVIRELGVAIHVHPAEAFGVAWEFYGHSFHDDPPPVEYVEPLKSPDYWREHPLGYRGLKRFSVAVSDLAAATTFFREFLGAAVLYEEARPVVAARAIGFTLDDTVAELISPIGSGPIEQHLARYGDGIRSTVFAVEDLDQVTRHFAERGVTLGPGDAPDTLMIAPEDNLGLLFEFSE
jgi:catechol 2,3-dioxygenase-like lactoylglutathione lyase family enzyme/predicted enzyme related to lactoylglutathione lyase